MFNFEGFGKRLQTLRKQKNMTQEEMADRIGVTPQAVSKWENDQSYPDITLIPTVATILGKDVNYLFGKKEEEIPMNNPYPDTYEGLPLVLGLNDVACYSNKTVSKMDNTGIKFTDGSSAELSTRTATNKGVGEIRFLNAANTHLSSQVGNYSTEISTQEYEFDYLNSVDIHVLFNYCELVLSKDNKTRVRATGEQYMLSRLDVEATHDTLFIRFKNTDDRNYNNHNATEKNKIYVELPCETGNRANIAINGMGVFKTALNFHNGSLTINGSGSIKMAGFGPGLTTAAINGSGTIEAIAADELEISVNGSGEIDWEVAKNAKIKINGSGNVTLENVTCLAIGINGSGDVNLNRFNGGGDFSAKINGSGDIHLNGGSCEKFDVEIGGSGDIHANQVTAREATIILRDSGEVTLGRVLEKSTEQIKKNGKITILNRGPEGAVAN